MAIVLHSLKGTVMFIGHEKTKRVQRAGKRASEPGSDAAKSGQKMTQIAESERSSARKKWCYMQSSREWEITWTNVDSRRERMRLDESAFILDYHPTSLSFSETNHRNYGPPRILNVSKINQSINQYMAGCKAVLGKIIKISLFLGPICNLSYTQSSLYL